MKLVSLPKGSKVLDTSARVTLAQAKHVVSLGYPAAWRCVGHSHGYERDNFTAEEARDFAAAGLGLGGLYGLFPQGEVSASTGAAQGALQLAEARAAGVPAGLPLCLDAEGPQGAPWTAWARAWLAATASWRPRWGYDGLGEATALTTAEKDALELDAWWDPGAAGAHHPTAGYALRQVERDVELPGLPGVKWDVNEVLVDGLVMAVADDDPRPAVEYSPSTPPAATTPPTPARFTFDAQLAGEAVGDRRARCAEEQLAGGSMGHTVRPAWYRSCINACSPAGVIAGQPVEDISAWATSCLIYQEAIDHHCGGKKPPPRNGAGFFEVYSPSKLRKPDGGKTLPKRGDVVYVANTGKDGHVVCVLHRNANGTWTVAAGGGGSDGTLCSIYVMQSDAHGYPRDHRGCQGWWSAEDLELPPSPPAPVAKGEPIPPEPPTSPETPNALAVPTFPPPAPPAPKPLDTTSPASRLPWGAFLARAMTLLGAAFTAASSWASAHPRGLVVVVAFAVLALLAVEAWRHRAHLAAVLRGPS